jgi:signal transduction histidine kinase
MQRVYERLERLERGNERHGAEIKQLREYIDDIKEIRRDIRLMEQSHARLEERIEQLIIQIEIQQKIMASWKSAIWALLMLLLGGVVAAGFELFKR